MGYGFTFNGRHCDEYGIVMRSRKRPLLPAVSDNFVQVPGRNGSYLFPGALQDRMIELECAFVGATLTMKRQLSREIASWLHTVNREELRFDDESEVHYMAKVSGAIDPDEIYRLSRFNLVFNCEPLAYGSPITAFFADNAINIDYPGTYATAPIYEVEFTGATDTWRVTKGSDYIRINHDFQAGDELYIDWAKGLITINGDRAMNKLDWQSSHFFDLLPGVNYLEVAPAGKTNTVVKYTPAWK